MKQKFILPIFFLIIFSLSFVLAMPPTIDVSSEFKVNDNIEFFLKNTLESNMDLSQVKIYDSNDAIVYGSGSIGITLTSGQEESVFVWNQQGNSGTYNNNIVQSGTYRVMVIYSISNTGKNISKEFNIKETNIDNAGCKDLDNGDNIDIPSRVIYYLEGQKHILQDTCFNSTYLYEAVCNKENVGESKGHNCNECFISDGYGFCKEESSQGESIPREKPIEEVEESEEKCKFGCLMDENCYPLGYRKSGEYCSENKNFIPQLKADSTCDNNFECSSNVCVSGKCVSPSLIEKILNWFKRLFGAD